LTTIKSSLNTIEDSQPGGRVDMEDCIFCRPSDFGTRKLAFEDKKGYWYAVVPREMGTFGQVLLVVKKMKGEIEHISDMSDPKLLCDKDRLLSIITGIHEISSRLTNSLTDQRGRRVQKVYVLTQCEGKNCHLHFQLLPRYEGDSIGNEFLYACELEEARWQDPPKLLPSSRIARGKELLKTFTDLLDEASFTYPKNLKSVIMNQAIQNLSQALEQF
jgi:diadenosine tetraphosphate (Ap4A) HIT family hydrolase